MEKNILDITMYTHLSWFWNVTVLCTLITQDNKNQLTRAFADGCAYQLHQLRHPGDVVWDAVRDSDDEAPPLPLLRLSAFTFFLMMLSYIMGVNYTFLHLCWGLGWWLWCIWPLSLLSQTIWTLLSVYKIKCEECDAVYVGETERPWRQGLANIGNLAQRPQRYPNTSTLITPTFRGVGEHWGIDNRAQMVC